MNLDARMRTVCDIQLMMNGIDIDAVSSPKPTILGWVFCLATKNTSPLPSLYICRNDVVGTITVGDLQFIAYQDRVSRLVRRLFGLVFVECGPWQREIDLPVQCKNDNHFVTICS